MNRGSGTGPASPVLAGPLFGDQVINIPNGAAQKRKFFTKLDTLYNYL